MDPVQPGLACGSDTAHLSIFGYDPRTHYRGRGAFESMGAGEKVAHEGCIWQQSHGRQRPAGSRSVPSDSNWLHIHL